MAYKGRFEPHFKRAVISWGASRNLTKDEITSRPNLALWCAVLWSRRLTLCSLILTLRVDTAHARQSQNELCSALAYSQYCIIALRLLFEEVEKREERV